MEPSSKRRRLAPKVPEPPAQPSSHALPAPASQPFPAEKVPTQNCLPAHDAAPAVTERHDFESFARHLQDAAMLIYGQTRKSPYNAVSVLMLRWEEDASVEQDLVALETVFRERYHYHTDKWKIPTVPNPSIKLGVQMASFLEHARPDHLLIIYYAGHGYVGPDNQLYWASNSREDAAKLKWDGVRCLFEDAQSDILLLLDSCAVRDAPMAGNHGLKQAIAAFSPDQVSREPGSQSFTASLVESLHKLSTGRPFSAERLHEEVLALRQPEAGKSPQSPVANGTVKPDPVQDRTPVFFTLTPGKCLSLSLAPLSPRPTQLQSPPQSTETDGQNPRLSREDQLISPGTVVDLTFDEPRVLVCTTFVGEASPDMTFFNQWLNNTPSAASNITVEGMFLGPPTMLLISMPHSIWNVVQHDKVCCFLGYITSHNMIHLYNKLVGSASLGAVTEKAVEDGRILLEAREAAASSPAVPRRDPSSQYPAMQPETPLRQEGRAREPLPVARTSGSAALPLGRQALPGIGGPKIDVEDSAEVQEAAEQLKALSHVRHNHDETPSKLDPHGTRIGDNIDVRQRDDPDSSPDINDSGADEYRNGGAYNMLTSKPKPRRSFPKQSPRQETRCTLCSHTPFKDSSSLRKHIAAAHTRPFPCAFSFAGCISTFGSKNEWKRHIASQHLCLQYYRCSSCPQSTAEGKGNEFNRKDLFTQHLRRMHAPFAIKKALAKGDSKLQVEWESHVKEMQQTCLVTRRQPPQRSACPRPDCQTVFEGSGSWDEWTEHVGRHMEKGEAQRLGVDRLLAKWALDEGIIEPKEDGEYRLCGGTGGGAEREVNHNSSFASDGGKREDEEPPSITVATALPSSEKMDVD